MIKHPEAIFIQLHTHCNASCTNCPHDFTYKTIHSKGFMNEATWEKIVNDIVKMNYKGQVGFYLHHEPLLDKTLYNKISDINNRTKAYVVISTNGALLDKKIRKQLIDAKPYKVHININSGDKGEYEKSMGLDFDKTIQNAKSFINETGSKFLIEINCPVLEGFKVDKLKELFPNVPVNLDFYANSRGGLLPELVGNVKGSRFKIEPHCIQPSQNFNILHDGSVIACCIDWMHESKNDFGNINNSSIEEIYAKVCEIEKFFINGDYSKYRMCQICSSEMGFEKGKKKMKIFLTNHHLLDYTGSEVYTLTLAEYLQKNNIDVVVYSKYVDKIEKDFKKLNIPVVYHLEEIKNMHFDVAHVHHNINAAEVRYFFPNLPIVFLSHGVLPFLEQPSLFNLNISHYLAISGEIKNNLLAHGVTENNISVVGNIIDNKKFYSYKNINKTLRNVLVVSAKISDEKAARIKQACALVNAKCKFVGGRFGEVKREQVADLINEADLVFSLGRGVIEALLCERNVIVFDEDGGDGLITLDNFDEIRAHNFSGRKYKRDFSVDELVDELNKYNPANVVALKKIAYNLSAAEKITDEFINIYSKAIDAFQYDSSVDFNALEVFYKSLQQTNNYSKILAQRKQHEEKKIAGSLSNEEEVELKYSAKVNRLLNELNRNSKGFSKKVIERDYDILIPIYNAYEQVKVCVESVLRNTKPNYKVYLLDDASPDKSILPMLKSFEKENEQVIVVEAEKNRGFVGNMNHGFALSTNDVIILNSDTEVTPNWVEKINQCAQSDETIGIVSPLSNNATILSVPNFNESNKLPEAVTVDEFAKIVEESSEKEYIELPTAVGFCMLIKREVLNKIGGFDEIFGLGYGEENDFCERAKENGYKIICCDDTYVHHYGEASFSFVEQIDERRKRNKEILESRWPNYNNEIFSFCRENPLRQIQERIYLRLLSKEEKSKPHIVQVLHNYNAPGGTEIHTKDISTLLSDTYRFSIIYPHSLGYEYLDAKTKVANNGIREIKIAKENNLANEHFNGLPGDLSSEMIEKNFANFISSNDSQIIHFQHLLNWSSLQLPLIAKQLGKKVILSVHDYFYLCPDIHLLFPVTNNRCEKKFASSNDEECLYCIGSKRKRRKPKGAQPINEYLNERYNLIKYILKTIDHVVVPSNYVKNKLIMAYGNILNDKILVVPHGIHHLEKSARPNIEKKMRIALLGNVTSIKGAEVFLRAVKGFSKNSIQFEIFGNVAEEFADTLKEYGINVHGGYKRETLPKLLSKTHLVVIPSITEETFGLTLSEAMQLGIPVLASRIGAFTERIVDGENGFLFCAGDSADLISKILYLQNNPDKLLKVQKNLSSFHEKTLEENAIDYDLIYKSLLSNNVYPVKEIIESFDNEIRNSIIVLTYNALDYTKKFYESYKNCNSKNTEIIFVDNASNDSTKEYLKGISALDKSVKLILNETNLGFPAGVNAGIKEAKGKNIVVANNDILLAYGWLERLIEVAESDKEIGLVGPISNEVSGLQKDENAKYESIEEMFKYAAEVKDKNKGQTLHFPRLAFLCTLIKKEVIEKIGGLDERFSPGNYEDDDFCLRTQLAGYKAVIAKDVFIHHYGSKSFKADGIEAYKERLNKNKQIFVDKWGVTPDELWLKNKPIKERQIVFPINQNLFKQYFERAQILLTDKEYQLAKESCVIAIENYDEEAEQIIPLNELLNFTGNISIACNDLPLAKECFEKELENNPNSSAACFGLGQVFLTLEENEAAKTMFEWAVKNDLANQLAADSLASVNQILGLEVSHNSLLVEV